MSLFRQLLIAKSQEKKKPYYCEVEYLESSGTQYIDTDIKPIISDTVKPVIKLVHQFNTLDTCRILGATDGNKYFQFFNNATGTDGFGIQLFTTAGHYTKFTLDTDKHVYEFNTASSIAKQDDTNQSLSFEQGSIDYNIYLFARNIKGSANNYMKGKIFYFEYDDGVQHRQFIPVLDNNMKPAMYDKVSGRLFYNQGTGEFTYGRQILPVQYIESDGSQYIDLGITSKSSMRAKSKFNLAKVSSQAVFGSVGLDKVGVFFATASTRIVYCNNTEISISPSLALVENRNYELDMSLTTISINGVNYTVPTTSDSDYNMLLFARTRAGIVDRNIYGKIYYFKLYDNAVLVRDLIPAVDENDVFFMFDNVTHTIYDNDGTGSFIGPTVAKDEQGKIVEPEYE